MRMRSFHGSLCGLVLAMAIATAQDRGIADQEQNAIHFYLYRVFQELERHKHYPEVAEQNGLSGRAVLRFTIRADGQVIDPQISVTGHMSFAEATLQALKASRLPPFPDDIRRRALMVEVPVTYRIETATGDEPLLFQEFLEALRHVRPGNPIDLGPWRQ